jgi:RNA polymerase-binding transcription factor DksA
VRTGDVLIRGRGLDFATQFAVRANCWEIIMAKRAEPEKRCSMCGNPIHPARLAAIPGIETCVECAKRNPKKLDPRTVDISQASPINRNGFAPTD